MKAIFVHDTYYSRAPDGTVYAFGAFPYSLWQERFLPHFHALTVIAREKPYEAAHALSAMRSDGPGVSFTLLPNINTPLKRILEANEAMERINSEVGQADAVIVRGPSEFGMIAARAAKMVKLTSINKPVAVEMSGCAFDHTWHHGSLMGKLYAPIKYLRARHMVKYADHVIYVTDKFLQSRYPARGKTACASNVEIEVLIPLLLEQRLKKYAKRAECLYHRSLQCPANLLHYSLQGHQPPL